MGLRLPATAARLKSPVGQCVRPHQLVRMERLPATAARRLKARRPVRSPPSGWSGWSARLPATAARRPKIPSASAFAPIRLVRMGQVASYRGPPPKKPVGRCVRPHPARPDGPRLPATRRAPKKPVGRCVRPHPARPDGAHGHRPPRPAAKIPSASAFAPIRLVRMERKVASYRGPPPKARRPVRSPPSGSSGWSAGCQLPRPARLKARRPVRSPHPARPDGQGCRLRRLRRQKSHRPVRSSSSGRSGWERLGQALAGGRRRVGTAC